jgi:hypothetical protein
MVEWAREEIGWYKKNASRLPKATGEGAQDFSYYLSKAGPQGLAIASFLFRDYIRYFDLKNLDRSKPPPINALMEWIQAKGIGKFKAGYIKRYGQLPGENVKSKIQTVKLKSGKGRTLSKLPSVDIRLMNSIAWGIIRGKRRKWKSRKWLTKGKWTGINKLEYELLDKVSETILVMMKEQFLKKG